MKRVAFCRDLSHRNSSALVGLVALVACFLGLEGSSGGLYNSHLQAINMIINIYQEHLCLYMQLQIQDYRPYSYISEAT